MIRIEGLVKAFGHRTIHRDIHMDIPQGERLCLVGGSGVGKSLLMKMIIGLEDFQEGEIYFEDQRMSQIDENRLFELMDKCGVVFQGAALFDSLNVRENVGLRLDEARQLSHEEITGMVMEVLEEVHLSADILDKFPAQLSGGMQKRVAFARAIIHQPRYLFYDEPTTGLDPENSNNIDELILKLAQRPDRTSIIITHDLQSIKKVATSVAMLKDESVIFHGSAHDFWQTDEPEVKRFIQRSVE